MLTDLEYQENQIKSLLLEMGSIYSEIRLGDVDENVGRVQFKDMLKRTIKICLVYFETKHLVLYRELFEKELGKILNNDADLFKGSDYDERWGGFSSSVVFLLWSYFAPFPGFYSDNISGLLFLENILDSTGVIVENAKKIPTKEHDVSKPVKEVIKAVFPNVEFPTPNSIIKCGTHYIPDIHVPLLKSAIEFKFSVNEKELLKEMDQILIDVFGYSNHPIFKRFYAGFYVKSGVISKERFKVLWAERNFPSNWKGIFIEGPVNVSPK